MAELEFLGALANQLAHRIAARELLEERPHVFSSPISSDMHSTIAGCKLLLQRDRSKVESAAATIYVV